MNIIKELSIDLDFSSSIRINEEKLRRLTESLTNLINTFQPTNWIDENYWPSANAGNEVISQFFTLGNSINFKYWEKDANGVRYCEGRKGGIKERGAMYLWRSLKLCLDKRSYDILDATQLSKIKFDDFRKIFQDDNGNDVLPSLETRYKNWKDLGQKLTQNWAGKTINIVNKANRSLPHFVEFFKEFKAFDDPLCKMIMVNAIMHQERGIVKFNEPIIPGMDYQILKQLLRQGVVIPIKTVAKKLRNQEVLDGNEALQLRRAGLYALVKIMERKRIGGELIDNLIWGNRKKCDDQLPVCKIQGRERECPFLDLCDKKTEFQIPLEETRYY